MQKNINNAEIHPATYPRQQKIVKLKENSIIFAAIYLLGIASLAFLLIKAISTGFWLDEAWICRLIRSFLDGNGWSEMIQFPDLSHRRVFFNNITASCGPTILVPGLIISMLTRGIHPPTLHVFTLSHILLVVLSLKLLSVRPLSLILSIWLIFTALTPEINATQYLGEFPGACWFMLGLAIYCSHAYKADRLKSFLVGACFSLSILSKVVFLLPTCTFFIYFFFNKSKRKITDFLLIITGFLSPLLIWHAYQLQHVGSWSNYMATQERIWEQFSNHSHGSGLGNPKSFGTILRDGTRLSRIGPAFALASLFLLIGFPMHRSKLLYPYKDWIFVSWLTSASGLLWWVLISNFMNSGALPRHAVGFVCIGILPAIYILLTSCKHILVPIRSPFLKKVGTLLFLLGSLVLSAAITQRSFEYVFHHKGYGAYSSWKEQQQLTGWINYYGTRERLLPLFNCDNNIGHSTVISHVIEPQKVLSSGLFEITECRTDAISRSLQSGFIVMLNGNTIAVPGNLNAQLMEGNSERQGLWKEEK